MEMTAIDTASATPALSRFTVDAKPLADALAFMTGKIMDKGARLPVLANVALIAWPDRLDIIATNTEMLARVSIAADTDSPGAFTLDANALQAIAKKAGRGETLEFTQEDNRIIIRTGRNRARVPFLPCDDFPMLAPIGADCHRFTLSAGFAQDLARVAPFMRANDDRYYLCGVALHRRTLAGRDRLLIAATTGMELSAWSRPIPNGAESLPDAILPAPMVKALLASRKLAGDGTLSAEIDQAARFVSIESGAVFIQAKLIDGTFPEIENIAAASIGDEPAQPLLIPELDPEMNPATLERMAKATGAALSWENVGKFMLAIDPANPDWFGMAGKGGMPKGYAVDYAQGQQSAARYLVDLAERRGLDAGTPDNRALVCAGGAVQGMTFGERVYVPASHEMVPNWENLTMTRIEIPARWDYVDGAYSVPMPRERQTLEAACSLTVDGQTYPLATNSRGDIHLSKDAVRKIIGESCFETMAITLLDGRAAFILQWLWDDGGTRFCTVRADGRCASGKAGDGTAGVIVTRADIEAAMATPIAAIAEPAPIGQPAPEILAAEPSQPESLTSESAEPAAVPVAPILPPVVDIAPGDDLAARIDALEMAVAALQAVQNGPQAHGATKSEKPADMSTKRTAAHERAIRRAWQERSARREAQAHGAAWKARRDTAMERAQEMEAARDEVVVDCERAEYALSDAKRTISTLQGAIEARDYCLKYASQTVERMKARNRANAGRAWTYRRTANAMRQTADQANAGLAYAISERNAARAELASLKRSLADPSNPMRVGDEARLIDEARALRAKVATLEADKARMTGMMERSADQLDATLSRVARAEAVLRKAGLLPGPVAIEAPTPIAA